MDIPSHFAAEAHIDYSLQRCLRDTYKLDGPICDMIVEKLSYLFDLHGNLSLIDDFLSLSKDVVLTIPLDQAYIPLDDAVIKAPETHEVLFENEALRVLYSIVQPGETVPLHCHQWDSIMIILQGSTFRIIDSAGTVSEDSWGSLVERFEGSLAAESYVNIGPREFRALAFELKK